MLEQINEFRNEAQLLKDENTRLRNSTRPQLDGLADLSDIVDLRFKYTYRNGSAGRPIDRNKSFKLTWREIFVAIAIEIGAPSSTSKISSCIRKHINENLGDEVFYTLFDTDAAIVKSQLTALGLLNVWVSKTLSNGALHEFMSLTDIGKSRLVEALAVKPALLASTSES